MTLIAATFFALLVCRWPCLGSMGCGPASPRCHRRTAAPGRMSFRVITTGPWATYDPGYAQPALMLANGAIFMVELCCRSISRSRSLSHS